MVVNLQPFNVSSQLQKLSAKAGSIRIRNIPQEQKIVKSRK